MVLFKMANLEEYDEIAKIMAKCFEDPLETVNFFLENKPADSKCYICRNDTNIISVLHAIFYKLNLDGEHFNCSYIYGACTEPRYRKQGYMQKLIKFCEAESKINGFDFMALVPDNKDLENYYYNLGYRNFFKIKEILLNREQLINISNLENITINQQNENNDIFDEKNYKNIENLRCTVYNNINSVVYSAQDIKYAADLYKLFGGRFINFEHGYAICVPESPDTVEVKDFTCEKEFIPDLLQKIYISFPDFKNFRIKTCVNDDFFSENYLTYFYGMIKPLSYFGGKVLQNFYLNRKNNAYLGLALD